MKFVPLFLFACWWPPVQDGDEVTPLLERLYSDSIEIRDAATKKLAGMGIKIRPRLITAMRDAPPDRRRHLQAIVDVIDKQPDSMFPLVDGLISKPPESIHRLIRDVHHRVRACLAGRDWIEVKAALDRHRLQLLKFDEFSSEHERGYRSTYLVKPSAWVAPGKIPFDLRLKLETRFHVNPRERTRHVVAYATPVWVFTTDRTFAGLVKERPFPKDSILNSMLDCEGVHKELATFPVVKEIEVAYSYSQTEFPSSDEHFGWHFYISLHMVSEDGRSGWRPSVYATSGLDPLPSKNGNPEPSWESQDTLGPVRSGGSSQWGAVVAAGFPKDHVALAGSWTLIDSETRKSWLQKMKPPAEPDDFQAWSVPDLAAIPADTTKLRMRIPELSEPDLAVLKRLPKLVEVDLDTNQLTPGMVHRLADAPLLTRLSVDTEEPTPLECFEALAAMPLEFLQVHHKSGLSDQALEALSRSRTLRRLVMTAMDEPVTNKGIAHLARMTELKELELWSFHDVTNEGLASLAAMKSLQRLELCYLRKVDDAGLKQICTLPVLEKLSLVELNVTDEGLPALVQAGKLKYFYVTQCVKVTQKGMDALKVRMPGNFELNRGWWSK